MSLAFAASELDAESRARAGVPLVPTWTLPRGGLDQLLDAGVGGMVTVVSGPTGSGKTLGVASWADGPTSPSGLVWLNLARGGADPDLVWRLLHRRLQEAGERLLLQVPRGRAGTAARTRALVDLGEALRDRGAWTVVLDAFPTGTPGQLGSELEIVLDHAGRALGLVVLCQSEPALDLHRFLAAGELTRVGDAALVMDSGEIGAVLRLANGAADRPTVAAVAAHTAGWACGVRQAAVALATTRDLSAAMATTDRVIEDYLSHEVLAGMTAPVRRLLAWTSVVEVVPSGVVRAVLGAEARCAIDSAMAATGLVERLRDGSIRCHPLLRPAARRELSAEPAGSGQDAHRLVVRWFADHGQPEAAMELCLAAGDPEGAASILVAAHAVPMIVAGTATEAVARAAALPAVQGVEPLLQTAFALVGDDLLAAEVTFETGTSTPGPGGPAHQIAAGFLALGIARLSGRSLAEPGLIPNTRGLVAQASVVDPCLGELTAFLDAFTGAVETSTGSLEQAVVTLTRGADRPPIRNSRRASADCAGQLALVDAFRGNLRTAASRASSVLAAATGDRWPGVAHAEVAMAWVHADRGELTEARARLGRVVSTLPGARDKWLVVARQLVEARVLIASGRADEAMRLAASLEQALVGEECSEWLSGLASSLSAEAMLAAGELKQALAVVTSRLAAGSAARAVLTAEARRGIGDTRGAAAAIASAAHELAGAPRALQLRGWLLDARLAHERDQLDRAILLVERALRAASAEGLRRPLAGEGAWLRWFLDRDGAALREHRTFVLSLVEPDPSATRTTRPSLASSDLVLEELTERETQVLALLALMCSTEEIATELFVSSNTVKTHLKGIFRKYGVNRRVDAVRRGRELGVC